MKRTLSIAALLCLPLMASAQNAAPPDSRPGVETRTWIDLQTRAGDSPAPARPMSGEVADQVYQRYLKSFSHPIPDQYERQKFVEGGGGQ